VVRNQGVDELPEGQKAVLNRGLCTPGHHGHKTLFNLENPVIIMTRQLLGELVKHVEPMPGAIFHERGAEVLFKRFRKGHETSFAGNTRREKLAAVQHAVEKWAHSNHVLGVELVSSMPRSIDPMKRQVKLVLTGLSHAQQTALSDYWHSQRKRD